MLLHFKNIPFAGTVVITIIAALFVLSLVLLFHVYLRYKTLTYKMRGELDTRSGFIGYVLNGFIDSYKRYGTETNTPAIISEAVGARLGGLLLCERFINNAVSLFVTLGLFGTFLGLSLSVGSLTELISYSNTSEWLSVLDSVGGGLMSALSGMGVAFYTSLVGVGCSILLTVLRSIFSPAAAREQMETHMELWLDGEVAPTVAANVASSELELGSRMIESINNATASMEKTLSNATAALQYTLSSFNKSVEGFNKGVSDFSDFNYSLSGTVERMDLAIRDLGASVRKAGEAAERSSGK